mgnify:FL=1
MFAKINFSKISDEIFSIKTHHAEISNPVPYIGTDYKNLKLIGRKGT